MSRLYGNAHGAAAGEIDQQSDTPLAYNSNEAALFSEGRVPSPDFSVPFSEGVRERETHSRESRSLPSASHFVMSQPCTSHHIASYHMR